MVTKKVGEPAIQFQLKSLYTSDLYSFNRKRNRIPFNYSKWDIVYSIEMQAISFN